MLFVDYISMKSGGGGLRVGAGLGRGVQWEDSFLSIHPQNRQSIDRAPESGYLINSLGDPQDHHDLGTLEPQKWISTIISQKRSLA